MISDFIMFDYPLVLISFAVFIPIIIHDILTGLRSDNTEKKHKQPAFVTFATKFPPQLQKKLTLSRIFFRVFLALSIIALAGPRWGTGYRALEYRRGLDTVFAIDVSRSMDIRDTETGTVVQSRLERGLYIARQSVINVSGARFAAAIGRNRGYLAVPLTYDNEAALSFLESLDGSSMTGRSTNLESLIEAAIDAFQSTSPARKVIVLISDGESHSGVLRNAINRCVREGIVITTVAVGSDEGRPVPAEMGGQSSAVSRRDAAVMRTTAERTGGIYIDGGRDDAASALSLHLLSLAHDSGSVSSRSESRQRRTLFIILAAIAYGASKFIPLIPSVKKTIVSMIAAVFLLTSCSEGRILLMEANYLHSQGRFDEAIVSYFKALNFKDSAPYAEYGIGVSYYLLDEGTAALNRYENSQKILDGLAEGEPPTSPDGRSSQVHRELRYRNHYNSGIIYFEEGNFNSAADAFREALRTDPRRIDAKRNLELSLMSIVMETPRENRTETHNETREIVFDYIRQQEQQQWKSREWTPEDNFTGPDY